MNRYPVQSTDRCSRSLERCNHQKNYPADPANFQPIALMSCIYKLFIGTLSKRLSSWAIQHNILSQEQNSARPTEGCYKHTFLLKSILRDARVTKSCLFIAWLDLHNTFGSIPLPATSSTLASLKLSSRLSATYTLEQPSHPYFGQLN